MFDPASGGFETTAAVGAYRLYIGTNAGQANINTTANPDGSNTITGDSNANIVDGGGGTDTINGGLGDDVLNGGLGNDSVTGGGGKDTFLWNIDAIGAQTDNYTLGVGEDEIVEIHSPLAANTITFSSNQFITSGDDTLNLFGNSSTYTVNIYGGSGIDTITASNITIGSAVTNFYGGGDNDSLTGSGGSRMSLWGGEGNDTLKTGSSSPNNGLNMIGGNGDDTYVLTNTFVFINENAGEGTADRVQTALSYALIDVSFVNIEFLETTDATSTAAINLIGNRFAQTITGNAGDNQLNGGLGVDTLIGGKGNDAYYLNDVGLDGRVIDTIVELANQGIDGVRTSVTVNLNEARYANVENGYLTGTAAINLGGAAANNVLIGNDGANLIAGLGGRDIMRGGLGVDTFKYFFNTDTGKTALTRDLIQDFTHLTDKIDISAMDANGALAGDGTFVFQAVKDTAFTGVAGQLHYLTSGANTLIEGDFNGDGVADFQIELTGNIATLTGGTDIIL